MSADIATRRLGGRGHAQNNVVCRYWKMGKCTRNPCRFLHMDLPTPKDYHRTPKQTGFSLPKRSKNNVYLRDASENKKVKKTFDATLNKKVKKISNPPDSNNSLASSSTLTGLELEACESAKSLESSSSSTEVVNIKKTRACSDWLSGQCVNGDACQFLHSWSYGDGFSMVATLNGHDQGLVGMALPSGSDKLFSGSCDGMVHIWDCHTGQSIKAINLGEKIGNLICEGQWIFIGLPNVIKAWNLGTGAEFNLNAPVGLVCTMEVHRDMLFAGTHDGAILAWKVPTEDMMPFQEVKLLEGHTATVTCLTGGAGGRLYSGSADNTIRVWDLNTLECIFTLNGHTDAVTSLLCWNEYLLSCSLDQTIKVWTTAEDGNIEVIYTHQVENAAIALCGIYDTEAKPILLCSSKDNMVHLYDLPSFNERGTIFSKKEVGALHGGPHGLFFTGDDTGSLTVWKWSESGKVSQADNIDKCTEA